jgi:Xaa-Pro aminopeptidase
MSGSGTKVVDYEESSGMQKKLTTPVLLVEGGGHDANLRYASHFSATDPVVLLVNGRRKTLVVSLLEFGRAMTTAQVDEVLTPQLMRLKGPARQQVAHWALGLLEHKRIDAVQVSGDFPVRVADYLRANGISVQVANAPLFPGRRRKSAAEIEAIRRSQRAAVRAMKVAMRMISRASADNRGILMHEGKRLRSETVRHRIEEVLLEHDCVSEGTIVAGGEQGAEPHERGSGALRTGQPVVVDIFPRHKGTGYWGDITRTVFHGRPHPYVLQMYRAVAAAQQAARAKVKAGVTVKRIHETAQATLLAHGFATTVKNGWGQGFIHSTGHGIGLDVHEAPSLSLQKNRLLTGDVITIEPGLYYRQWGGVRIEDTFVVTRTGTELLVPCPAGVSRQLSASQG